jgi:hypothetical protein
MLKTVQIGGHKIKLTKYIYNQALELGESTIPQLYFKIMVSLGGNIDLPLIPQINKMYRSYLSRLIYLVKKGGLYVEHVPARDRDYDEIMRLLIYCVKNNISSFTAEYRDETYNFRVLNIRDILKHSYLSFFFVAERLAMPQYIEEIVEATGLAKGLVETYLKVLKIYKLVKVKNGRYVFKNKDDYIRIMIAGEAKKQRVLDKLMRCSRAIMLYKEGYDIREISRLTGLSPQYICRLLSRNIIGSRILLYAKRLYEESLLPAEDYETLESFLKGSEARDSAVEEL